MGIGIELLNWYWWRNRFSIMLMVLSVIVAQAAFWLSGNELPESFRSAVGFLLLVSMLASFFCAIAVFADGRYLELTCGKSAFPAWLFSLPVSTGKLALVPVVGMFLGLAWAWIPFAWAISFGMPKVSLLDLVVLPWLGLCAAACWLQFASWRPFRSGWYRLAAIVVAILVAAVLIALGPVLPYWYPSFAVIVSAATGFTAALFSVSKARHCGWRSELGVAASDSSTDSNIRNSSLESFTKLNPGSGMLALRWHDWHRTGRFIAILMFLIAAPMVLLAIWATPPVMAVVLVLMLPTWVMASVSPAFGKDSYVQGKFEMSHYLAALPITDRMFLKSRLENALKVAFVAWFMGLIVFLIWLAKTDNLTKLQGLVGTLQQLFPSGYQTGWPMFIGCVLLTLYTANVASFPGMALGLCGRRSLELAVTIALGSVGFVVVLATCFFATSELERLATPEARSQYMEWVISWIPSVVFGLLIAKILVTAVSFWVAGKRVSINWNSDAGKLIAGIVVCLFLVALFCFLIPTSLMPLQTIAIVVVLLFPCASLILAFAALDWNRHR